MQIPDDVLREVEAALVARQEQYVAAGGCPLDDDVICAMEQAALARLRKAMEDEYDPNNPDHGDAWKRARSKLVEMLFRLADAKGESYEAMLDIAANEILKAAFPRKAMEDGKPQTYDYYGCTPMEAKDGCSFSPDLMAGGTDCALCGRPWEDHTND